MKPWKIIQKLESDNSRLFKESVIEENINAIENEGAAQIMKLSLFFINSVTNLSKFARNLI